MVNHERYSAWRIGRIGAVLLLLILHSGVVYAEFEPKAEYQSIIATDPKISQVFRQLFLGMNKPQVDRVAEGVFLARGFGQGNAVILEGEDGVVVFWSETSDRKRGYWRWHAGDLQPLILEDDLVVLEDGVGRSLIATLRSSSSS